MKSRKFEGKNPHILLLEPYYGGSHRAFLRGLINNLSLETTLLTLPARKWKMRMQTAAPWMAARIIELWHRQGRRFHAIVTSSFLDVPLLRSLLDRAGICLPLAVYFHENQFAYPSRIRDPSYFQFTCLNWTSGLAADRLYFNSSFNFKTYLEGIRLFVKKVPDVNLDWTLEQISNKSVILYPGMDFTAIDAASPVHCLERYPVILWNHRWEHDKDPETFFQALFLLKEKKRDFRLIVLGQSYRDQPSVFREAGRRLNREILHLGYVQDRQEYIRWLHRADLVISTARHEFFGLAVMEAVRAGCRPLVPDHLSYPELYPARFRYPPGQLARILTEDDGEGSGRFLRKQSGAARSRNRLLAEPYGWARMKPEYEHQFELLSALRPSANHLLDIFDETR